MNVTLSTVLKTGSVPTIMLILSLSRASEVMCDCRGHDASSIGSIVESSYVLFSSYDPALNSAPSDNVMGHQYLFHAYLKRSVASIVRL